jgi:hypothetical protein
MNNIIFFILGVAFIVLILPILQELSELLCLILESAKSVFAKFVAKKNVEIEEINAPEVNTNAIGFEIPSFVEEDEYEEEEKLKHKIGF